MDFAGVDVVDGLLADEPSDMDHRSSKPDDDAGFAAAAPGAAAPPIEPVRMWVLLGVMMGEV